MGANQVTEADVGKPVVYDGDTVGRIVEYTDATAYVDPDPDLADTVRSKLGWGHADEESFPLQRELVEEITDDEIRLMARL
jgi:hypothetical protein